MAARITRFRMNPGGVDELLRSEGVRGTVTEIAEPKLAAAKANAPVLSGAYQAGLHIEQDTTDRVVVRITGSTDHDIYVEADTGNLARALDA